MLVFGVGPCTTKILHLSFQSFYQRKINLLHVTIILILIVIKHQIILSRFSVSLLNCCGVSFGKLELWLFRITYFIQFVDFRVNTYGRSKIRVNLVNKRLIWLSFRNFMA